MIPPATVVEPSSDDFSDVQSSSPAAAYAKRHHARMIRRCDGSDDLRPLHGAGSLGKRDREGLRGEMAKGCSPKSLAGFGVKEVEKKILPCHRVSEDGLVRITCNTVRQYSKVATSAC
jgi:M-phase inducer tyrosine phosphatase